MVTKKEENLRAGCGGGGRIIFSAIKKEGNVLNACSAPARKREKEGA